MHSVGCVASRQFNGARDMASWIDIDRVRKDPALFKPLAKRLLNDPIAIKADRYPNGVLCAP